MPHRIWLMTAPYFAPLYDWSLKRWRGDEHLASFLTACAVAGALGMNVALFLGVLSQVAGPRILPKGSGIALMLAVLALVYVGYVHSERHARALEFYRQLPLSIQRRKAVVAWTYLLGSYVVPVAVFTILANRSGP